MRRFAGALPLTAPGGGAPKQPARRERQRETAEPGRGDADGGDAGELPPVLRWAVEEAAAILARHVQWIGSKPVRTAAGGTRDIFAIQG